MTLPDRVQVVEVGPRDGLQNEPVPVPTEVKLGFIQRLVEAGCTVVEATSFVHPRAVPQMADAGDLLPLLPQGKGVRYPVLVPTRKGLERAIAAGAGEVAVFLAATESFTRANLNREMPEALADAVAVVSGAREAGLRARGYISVAFGCPYEGDVPPAAVAELAGELLEMGCEQVVLGDTIGVATPGDVHRVLDAVQPLAPAGAWGLHFHDTRGTALANVLASMERGIASFDASAGGLGGCPFAGPNASGNLATEDLVYLLDGMGIQHGIDLDRLLEASRFIQEAVGHPLRGKVFQAGGRLRPSGRRQPVAPRGAPAKPVS